MFEVIAPGIANFLMKKNLMELLPRAPLVFLSDLTNLIIENRKKKLEVIKMYFNFLLNFKIYKLELNKRREDFIQTMIEHEENVQQELDDKMEKNAQTSNKNVNKILTNNEIISQAILFFLAGYETTSTTLEWISFHLARNQDVQNKLINEIDIILDKYVIVYTKNLFLIYYTEYS